MSKLLGICVVYDSTMSFTSALSRSMLFNGSTRKYMKGAAQVESSANMHGQKELYSDHIKTNAFQKTLLSIGASVTALLDPFRHDMVAVLGETTGAAALKKVHKTMLHNGEGKSILFDKPRINSHTVDLDELALLPDNTLGKAYVTFLNINKVSPDTRMPVQFVDDPELAYVIQRYREVHDLIHTVLGMPTNMLGEVVVKWVEAIQYELPMCIGGAIFGSVRLRPKQREKYLNSYLPWAIRVGQQSSPLMNVYFEKRWTQPLADIRVELSIEPPPQ